MNNIEEPEQIFTASRIAIEIIGWLGAAALLIGYFLIQTGKVNSTNNLYMALNIIGSFCLLINTWYHAAYPSVVTNGIWLLIGAFTTFVHFYRQE